MENSYDKKPVLNTKQDNILIKKLDKTFKAPLTFQPTYQRTKWHMPKHPKCFFAKTTNQPKQIGRFILLFLSY